jgi:internalin A
MRIVLTVLIILLFFNSLPLAATAAQPQKAKSFLQWCQEKGTNGRGSGLTTWLILFAIKTQDCQLASSKVNKITKLELEKFNIPYLSDELTDLSPLASLPNLTYLSFNGRKLTDLKPLASLSKLTHLAIVYGRSEDNSPKDLTQVLDLKPLANLNKLNYLLIETDRINDIRPLANLYELTELLFGGKNIKDFKPLSGLVKLKTLSLINTNIHDISSLSGLSNLTNLYLTQSEGRIIEREPSDLEELDLSNNNKPTDLNPLSSLNNLATIYFDNIRIKDLQPLANLKNLKQLYMKNSKANDLKPLANLTSRLRLK